MNPPPYTLAELTTIIDEQLDLEINRLLPDEIAEKLAPFPRAEQERAIHLATIAARGHTQIGYQVGMHADAALKLMEPEAMEAWVVHALDLYDRKGLFPAITSIKEVEQYAREAEARARGVVLEDIAGVLSLFVRGLAGRELKIKEGASQWTDTETLYLPPFIGAFEAKQDNFELYKAMCVHQWAQAWFGTWRVADGASLAGRALAEFGDERERVTRIFHRLETIRLDARIRAELPGIHRDMMRFLAQKSETLIPAGWQQAAGALAQTGASVETSLALLKELAVSEAPAPVCFEGEIDPGRVDKTIAARVEKEKADLQWMLWKLTEELKDAKPGLPDEEGGSALPDIKMDTVEDSRLPEGFRVEVTIEAEPVAVPENAQEILKSIMQDFSEIPEEYLQPAGSSQYDANREGRAAKDVWSGTYHEEGAFFYDEWDFKRQHYRKDWCVLREMDVKPADPGFADRTVDKYHSLVAHIRKSFEALRGENAVMKRQPNGENIDMEALVEALADARRGEEMTDRLYTRVSREDRSIAVLFMVDMSGSTKGWINDAERESLVLLCEALETLGDRYAIYGFSGWARKRCEIFPVKSFEQNYDSEVKARIAGIEAKDYTRMGAAIRHLSGLLNEIDAKTRLLVTLSDGKPDDYDDYGGQYGIDDTRMALLEARRSGIHAFCITIDREGQDYLPYMYGPASYAVIDEVGKLPFKVADIYRKLTT